MPNDLRPISESVASLTKGTFSRKFVSLARILTSWSDIVGTEMASRAQPAKLTYRKPKSAGEKPQAVLDIAVSSADATTLHYQKDLILERINRIFGDRWVTAIRFVHRASNGGESTSANRLPALEPQDFEKISKTVAGVDDPEIRNRLEKLGQGVLSRLHRKTP